MSDTERKKIYTKEETYLHASNEININTVVIGHVSSENMHFDNVVLNI